MISEKTIVTLMFTGLLLFTAIGFVITYVLKPSGNDTVMLTFVVGQAGQFAASFFTYVRTKAGSSTVEASGRSVEVNVEKNSEGKKGE